MSERSVARREEGLSAKRGLAMSKIQDMPGFRQVAMLVMLIAAIAGGLWVFSWSQSPSYVPLFAELAEKEAAEISDALRRAQVEFRLDPASGLITVQSDQVHEARMLLAAEGLPQTPQSGIETMQGEQGFGTSQFVETARYQHALESELIRTISSLRAVKDARVHLALPKPSAFTRPQDQASASVLLTLFSGRALSQDQVAAVVHLVASSIPGLAPERVTVVDQSGRLLTQQNADSDAALNAAQFERTRRLESTYQQRIESLLEPLTGPGRVSAQVTIDMDFAITEEAREQFAPDPAKIRSEQVSQQSGGANANSLANAPAQGVPGAASNTPAAAQDAASNASSLSSSSSATRNFELDRTVSHVVTPAGRVRRVTAAVLVDHVPAIAAPAANATAASAAAAPATADRQPAGTRALTAEELAQIEKLVREAVGFDDARGDSVSVMNAPFVRDDEVNAEASLPFWEQLWLREVLRSVFGGIAVLILLLMVLRPAVKRLVSPDAEGDAPDGLPKPDSEQRSTLPVLLPVDSYEQKVQLARTAVGQDPKRVAQLVKSWVGNEA